MGALRTDDGRPLPSLSCAELDRLRRRLVPLLELIRDLEAERTAALAASTETAAADNAMARNIILVPRARRLIAGRPRRIAIVAMARKLLIALWRCVKTGVLPEGIAIRGEDATA